MKAVYIHIPFCKSICSYCDFCKMFYHPKWSHQYLLELQNEINDTYLGEEISTIYIGGGTPSALSLKEIDFLLHLTQKFKTNPSLEFTFECNIEDIQEDLLKILKKYHVNRLSIGIESFQQKNQMILGREHSYPETEEKIKLIRKYGFQNINLDLIYAIPHETLNDLKKDLKMFLKLKPDHISTYSLMIEPHTILYRNKIQPIDEDLDRQMYDEITKILKKKKYIHYEVSNFALKNKESRHNLIYWNNEEYYGFGLGASGYYDHIRYTNTKNMIKYLQDDKKGSSELLNTREEMENEVMLGLRKLEGISLTDFENKYHVPFEKCFPMKPLLKNKELKQVKDRIMIPEDKIYVMNEILNKMI